MTVSETLIAAASVMLLLVLAALGIARVRNDLKSKQVWELLATLDEGLSAYCEATGQWPVEMVPSHERQQARAPEGERGPGGDRETEIGAGMIGGGDSFSRDPKGSAFGAEDRGRPFVGAFSRDPKGSAFGGSETYRDTGGRAPWQRADGSAERVITALAAVPASRAVLERIPEVLRVPRQGEDRDADADAWGTVQDAWGHRLRCLTAASPSEVDRQAVAGNGGRPIFVSAGPDGQFGIHDPAAAADNIILLPSPTR